MRVQLLLDQVGDGRLAGAREAGEPQHGRLLVLEPPRASRWLTSSACQWMFCARRRAKWIMPGADRAVGDAVDQDEAAECRGSPS